MSGLTDAERVYAAISDAFYDARNSGRTMTAATGDATDAVEKLFAAREKALAEKIAQAIEAARDDLARSWGGSSSWLTTGERVADLFVDVAADIAREQVAS